MKKYLISSFSLIAFIILLFSCSVEKKFAREFIRYDSVRTAMVIPPDFIYKTSWKDYEVENADELSWWELDSILYENSLFLQYIWDEVYIEDYYNAYCDEMRNYGYVVLEESEMQQFLSGNPDTYLLNLTQVELEEYVIPVIEEEEYNNKLYYQMFNLNAVNANSWIEISTLNGDETNELVFSSLYLAEEVVGHFSVNNATQEVYYPFDMDTLYVDEVYQLAALSGYLYAGYTFDYFMNKYVDKRMEDIDKRRSDVYFHYNRKGNYLSIANTNQRFIPLND